MLEQNSNNSLMAVKDFLLKYSHEINSDPKLIQQLKKISESDVIRKRLSSLADKYKNNSIAYLDILLLKKELGIINENDWYKEYKVTIVNQLQTNNERAVDTACAIVKNFAQKPQVVYSDFPAGSLKSNHMSRSLHCLQTTDWRITRDILAGVEINAIKQNTSILALADLPGFENDIQLLSEKLMTNATDRAAGCYLYLAKSKDQAGRLRLAKEMVQNPIEKEVLLQFLEKTNFRDKDLKDIYQNAIKPTDKK